MMGVWKRLAVSLAAAALLAGCQAAAPATLPSTMPATPAATEAPAAAVAAPTPGELTVVDAKARPAPLAGGTGAAYLTVLNGLDQPVQLVSMSSPAAEATELHETLDDNGVMRMVPHPEGFAVPAGGALLLEPGGKHVMLLKLVKPLAGGDQVDLALNFDNGQTISVTVPVVAMAETMPGAMAGGTEMAGMGAMTESMQITATATLTDPVAALVARLPMSAIHELDESLAAGKGVAEAQAAVATLDEVLADPAWPAELQPQVVALRAATDKLRAAVDAGDLAAAAPLAHELHELLHKFQHSLPQHND